MEIDFGLEGKVALVTGGGQGIGSEIALTLSKAGCKVAVVDIAEEAAENVAKRIRDNGGTSLAIKGDVTSYDSVCSMVEAVKDHLGVVQVLVNVAGGGTRGWFAESVPSTWDRDIRLNLFGVMNCTKAVMSGMVEQKKGVIVSITSEAGRVGEAGMAAYAAAKGGVISFTKSIAREQGRFGIRANAVAPGATMTERLAPRLTEKWDKMVKSYPLGRLGEPTDVANLVLFLASDLAGFITGQIISVSGGYTML
ncbi:SDR family NAD(P)-dependent oxidoreductase [Paradesulfitobacterium ferrireducens]|uniref:SDR family NAD(P)-dependent oxidoreductase n=1 Tax=Paradesulfitobacterium ferrireducens TaxID=2816476 RepID=UPI001A8E86B1|nr:SDR family oxidoreductase [Paradesulfitobacterium ferrireducens]